MSVQSLGFRLFPIALLAAALAACSGGGSGRIATGAPVPAPATASEIEAIAQSLDQGEERAARRQLTAALKRDPMNPSLLVLQQGLTGDAKADLGPTSFPYTVRDGDTISALAARFLGTRLKSYQLARYNDIANPGALAAGQILRIPGQPPRAAPEPRPTSRASGPAPARSAPPAPAAPASPPARAANPAAAQSARTAGLAALNQGNVAQAVAALRRAAALDPGNPAIARDLARAERIAATVRSRR